MLLLKFCSGLCVLTRETVPNNILIIVYIDTLDKIIDHMIA